MGLTHDAIVKREVKKYGDDWIVLEELTYGGYRFDIFAFNPKTKIVEITEVDVASETTSEKISFAETLGKVRQFRNVGDPLPLRKFQGYAHALGSSVRVAMLESLVAEGRMTYSDLLLQCKMKPQGDAGKFGYHLNLLLKSGLIVKDIGQYACSDKAAKILEFFRKLD